MLRMEVIFKLVKVGFVLPFAAAGYLGVWAETEGSVRVFMLVTFGPFLLAVGGDEAIGYLRALRNLKSASAK